MNCFRSDQGEETTLRIEGALDAVSAPELRPTLDALVAERRGAVIVDLSALRLIDSSGVGALVSLYKRIRERGGNVRIVNITDQPAAIFKLLKLDTVLCNA